jgi:hypothetical protein
MEPHGTVAFGYAQSCLFRGGMTGRVALGYARRGVPKTSGRISVEKVALGVAGLLSDRYGRRWL